MGFKFAGRLAAAVLTLGAVATAGQAMAQTYTSRVEKVVTYTANGQVQTEADGKNNLTTYEYDGFDRLVKVRYPDPNTPGVSSTTDYEQYGYDAAGNRTSWRRRSGETVAFTYDALNRAMSGLRGEAYTYDNLGRRTDAAYNGYTHQAAYDALGRTTLERTNTLTVSYEYDLAGRRTKITWPDGVFARYDRHVTGEVSTIHENGLNLLASYAYDDLGRVASRTYANGTDTSYGYDAASRLAQLNLNVAGTDKDQAWTFAYNAAGQVITRTAANGLYEWTQSQASKTYGVNGLNQLTSAGGAAVSYDLRGNLSLNGGVTHGYDLANNLTATSGGAVLAYEPTGRLWQVSAGGATTQFLYAGSDLIAEYGPGGQLRRYVPGDGVDQPLVWYEGAGLSDRRFLLQDAQGSVAAVTNGAGAATINSYDEYGVPAATNQGRFQYTGQIWMSEVGLYHYKARAYSPTLGRFLQTDPIGYGDGLNWYAYVGNDPVNSVDPTGLYWMRNFSCTASDGPNGELVATCRNDYTWMEEPEKRGLRPREVARVDLKEVDRRICETAEDLQLEQALAPEVGPGAAFGRWVGKVRPGGPWDDKHKAGMVMERMGNFAYGATAAALGLSEKTALNGAGGTQMLSNGRRAFVRGRFAPSKGFPGVLPPYGDDPRDQAMISEGYNYGKGHPCGAQF